MYELPHKQRFRGDHDLSPLQQLLNWVSHTLLGRPSRGSTHSAFAISRMASQTAPGLAPSDSRASAVGSAVAGRPAFARSDTFFLREMRTTELLGRAVVAPDNGYLLLWQQLVLALSFYSAFITPLEFSFLPALPPGLAIADGVVSIFFLVDLILTFFVAFKDQKTQRYVCDHWSIATSVVSIFFLADLILTFFVAFKDRKTQSYVCDHWSIATRSMPVTTGALLLGEVRLNAVIGRCGVGRLCEGG
ncbi:unnamed protein product [Closterium sp. Yama58-4]|nr:unnamed protein product [Closterium sp. Yama58-4]